MNAVDGSFPEPVSRETIPRSYKEGETVPDHHPLARSEVVRLLKLAKQHEGSVRQVVDIQCRLSQGVNGMTCPVPLSGPVAEKQRELFSVFLAEYGKGCDPDLVDRIHEILQ